MTAPKVYNPYGLCAYFEKEPEKRAGVAAGNLKTEPQLMMFRRLTEKTLLDNRDESSEDDADINSKKKTARGKKYDFIKKNHEKMQ